MNFAYTITKLQLSSSANILTKSRVRCHFLPILGPAKKILNNSGPKPPKCYKYFQTILCFLFDNQASTRHSAARLKL